MTRFQVIPAAYVALLRGEGDDLEVLLQRRAGTGFMDGQWAHGAAGHVEARESVLEAAVREAREELGVTVSAHDLEYVGTTHRTCAAHDPREERVDIFFATRTWQGELSVQEPGKSAGIGWFALKNLPDDVVPHERAMLQRLRDHATPALLTIGFEQRLTLVAAMAPGRAIGHGGDIPWRVPGEMKHFKDTTMGGTLIMGRRTWDSIGRPLPGRRTIVITRDQQWSADGAEVAHSLVEALHLAGDGEVFIAGGAQVYEAALPWADRMVLTHIDPERVTDIEADTFFPEWDPAQWNVTARDPRTGFEVVTYQRTS